MKEIELNSDKDPLKKDLEKVLKKHGVDNYLFFGRAGPHAKVRVNMGAQDAIAALAYLLEKIEERTE